MLHHLVSRAAARTPQNVAVRAPDAELSYGELDAAANRMARALSALGVGRGDRVGIWLAKSAKVIVAMQGVLRLGAAYVPIDSTSPASRAKKLLADCGVKALIAERTAGEALLDAELRDVGLLAPQGHDWSSLASFSSLPLEPPSVGPNDLAYILYTSGSTGRPKGVCISHSNALSFVTWAVDTLGARQNDRFANHAPFHFDLSVLDLYAAFAVGARVCIVPEGAAYAPKELVRFLREEEITVWYSVPSALVLMMDHGALLDAPPDRLRVLLFAGESFPMKHLRRLRAGWPRIAMWNLYGPTETNVCTAYEVCAIDEQQLRIPIGRATCDDDVWIRTDDEHPAAPGDEGELMVRGPTVFLGYWGHTPRPDEPYATGDVCRLLADGNFEFIGRRDSMVKVRGHRIELGEIEAALVEHPDVQEAVALVVGDGPSARLHAFLGVRAGQGPTLLEIKRHCAERLPRYMIADDIHTMQAIPRNARGKIDRQALLQRACIPR